MNKDKLRQDYITEHGICCETCRHNPVNAGIRDCCRFEDDCLYTDENNQYEYYDEAASIYSIDIGYCC